MFLSSRHRARWGAALVAAGVALSLSCGPDGGPDASDGAPAMPDADGDGIPDAYEGRPFADDTDGDGTADYLDLDSDDDGLPDALEGQNPGGAPVDSDSDGTDDFRDLDSDANGIVDAIEGGEDTDGDHRPNSGDDDDDDDDLADTIEIDGRPDAPPDHDGDRLADFRDVDSDDDAIGDWEEAAVDTDRDLVVDRFDDDSDRDGVSDRDEAGDEDPFTRSVDSDRDSISDYRDPDSDDDGLADSVERELGTERTSADTDRDGATDLIEVGAGTDPFDPADHPRARGDFVFLVPEAGTPEPASDVLDFATDLRRADVYFLMDTTGSMDEEIATLRADLEAVILPAIRARIPESRIGVGRYDDYPTDVHGGLDDVPYAHVLSVTDDVAEVVAAVGTLGTHFGGDRPESAVPAMWSALTGGALDWPEPPEGDPEHDAHPVPPTPPSCAGGTFGYPCFRPDAVPVLVNITDAPLHNGPADSGTPSSPYAFPAPTYEDLLVELGAHHGRVIWIDSGDSLSRQDGRRLATDSGALDGTGAPLVFPISRMGVGLTEAIVEGIRQVSAIALDLTLRWADDPSDAVDTRAAFVSAVRASDGGVPARGCAARPAIDVDADGTLDGFPGVGPGERVCFEIVPRANDTVTATLAPQVFRATLTVVGDGFTPLDERDVYFLVPPRVPDPGEPF